ncbi:MAG: MarR family transcriptional regulator [Pseudonocardia sp.]|jgi:DNA-binding MarR family transcriptional regulator|nr:MarR family transcriptional regulator [Pseudonocardia sp.]
MDTSDMTDTRRPGGTEPSDDEIAAVMLAARAIVAITAQSVAALDDQVTLPQLRVLVMIASRGPLNLAAVAQGLDVHSSTATRVCDKLVHAGMLHRSDNPDDRRNLVLDLTADGRTLVDSMTRNRRAAIKDVLTRMPPSQRQGLPPKLRAFAEAAGELPDTGAWALGWTTENPVRDPGGSAA